MAKRKEVKIQEIRNIAKLQCTRREAAAFLNIRHKTFDRLLASDSKVAKAWEEGKQLGLISLRRKQFRLASENSSMAIHLGKQYLGQHDKKTLEHTNADGAPLDFSTMNKEEREKLRSILTSGENEEGDSE